MTGNSVEKCFAVWNVIQNFLLTLKPNIYCFCLEHYFQHDLFCLFANNKCMIYGPELNLSNRVFSYLLI